MRPVNHKHCSVVSINPEIHDKSSQFTFGLSSYGISFVLNCIILRCGFDINFPFVLRYLKGFEKNLFCKTIKLSDQKKLDIQIYFKDYFSTGLSICHNVPDFEKGKRSYISICLLGFFIYIAKCCYIDPTNN